MIVHVLITNRILLAIYLAVFYPPIHKNPQFQPKVQYLSFSGGIFLNSHLTCLPIIPVVLSIDAIGRTFKPLWKTRNGFQIRDVGNHIILFVFDDENEADKVVAMEPWTFVKHLFIFSRFDGSCPVRSLQFDTVNFWIQMHGLALNRLNEKTAFRLGKSLGTVTRTEQKSDLFGGDFLQVWVGIDVSKPLCRDRKVMVGREKEVWVS